MLPAEFLDEIAAIFKRCRDRYPTVGLPCEPYCARIVEVLAACHRDHGVASSEGCADCRALLRELHHEDLYLALACSLGDRIAWEFFADEFMPMLQRFAAQACHYSDLAQDLAQDLLSGLFGEQAADPAAAPVPKGKLGGYNGRGSLSSWLRAAVAHAAIDRFRRGRRQVSLEELLERGDPPRNPEPAAGDAPEERLDAHLGPVLAQSLQQEIAALNARDRLLLCLYHVQGVPLKTIGARFGVHEATASRWLDRIRAEVRKRVERKLRKSHGLSAHDLKSVWRYISEAGDASLNTVLQPLSGSVAQKTVQGPAVESSSLGVGNE